VAEEEGQRGGKSQMGHEASTHLYVHWASEIHQSQIHWLLDQLKRDLCRTKMVNVFAQVVVADPCCLAMQKSQPTPSAVAKYLKYLRYYSSHTNFRLCQK